MKRWNVKWQANNKTYLVKLTYMIDEKSIQFTTKDRLKSVKETERKEHKRDKNNE